MYIGIDPAFENIGLSSLDLDFNITSVNHIRTEAKKGLKTNSDYERAIDIFKGIEDYIEKEINSNPEKEITIVSELPQGSRSARANRLLGITSGVLASLEASISKKYKNTKWIKVSPSKIKKLLGKDTSKNSVISNVVKRYGINLTSQKKPKYIVKGKKYNKGQFEHIADSILAILTQEKK